MSSTVPKEPVQPELVANWQTLQRIFIRLESKASRKALVKYMQQILFGLHDFLKKNVGITREASLLELSQRFTESRINSDPAKKLAEVIRGLIEDIAPHAVNVASPYFVGHMTSAIPFFMVHLATIMAALNQNPVKLETSKVVSIFERQVLAKIHRQVFGLDDRFYEKHVQNPESTLGSFVDDGTLANLTALWVARNKCLHPKKGFAGVEKEGMANAFKAHNIDRCIVLVSSLAHHSLRKAGGVLGIGNENIIPVDVDDQNRINMESLTEFIDRFLTDRQKTKIVALVGIAGTTETGTVDPLLEMARLCARYRIHFHVDAAWGGPTLLSDKYRHLLSGIEQADSVTIDGHKQFYLPMGCGMVYFKDPGIMDHVAYHAEYINRPGSVDLGIRSLEGSRAATSLVLGSALEIMGARGYGLLIDHGIDTARLFAEEIERRELFELVTAPQLNILTYRINPPELKKAWHTNGAEAEKTLPRRLNNINIKVQRQQREAGQSFVSRTTLRRTRQEDRVVFRAVIMNPMTDIGILKEILDEQEMIYRYNIERNDI